MRSGASFFDDYQFERVWIMGNRSIGFIYSNKF